MFRLQSQADYDTATALAKQDPAAFWATIASHFTWQKPWHTVLEADMLRGDNRWFSGAELNITENCLDRHLADRGNKTALIWEPNNPAEAPKTYTYRQLHAEVCQFAAYLTQMGVTKGERVCLYMPMVPELAIAVLACARIGAVHSVVFGGFSAQALADRISDAGAVCLITHTHINRGAKTIDIKPIVDEALAKTTTIRTIVTFPLTAPLPPITGNQQPAALQAEDPLFILYTSGSTGKPKGVVHTCGGYMVYAAYTFQNVFQYDAPLGERAPVHFCTADIGWITGHSYIVYGPLVCGATTLLFEGVPTYPDAGRMWDVVDKHDVNILYTAPTAIRSLMGFGLEPLKNKDLSSLTVLGSVGEPINEEAWHWYDDNIGKNRCPIVDTWWQTENGGILISPLAGITRTKPSFATLPLPGVQPVLVDENGKEIEGNGVSGNLCIKFPWPGILRTTYGDHERCRQTYFATYPGLYFTGDGCLRDEDGYYRITGRVDDVLNVSGHRIGTAEVENAINMHTGVVESAVVGYPQDIKGQGIYAYVIADAMPADHDADLTKRDILATVTRVIGAIAKPDKIQFVSGLPKTRSGKIMRRILRKIAEGDTANLGDISTLLDPAVVEEIKNGVV